jgi:hypothetical protein
MAASDCSDLMWTAVTSLARASLVALGIAWDAHVKFTSLLQDLRPDELDMVPSWERRSLRWRGIALVTFGLAILIAFACAAAAPRS